MARDIWDFGNTRKEEKKQEIKKQQDDPTLIVLCVDCQKKMHPKQIGTYWEQNGWGEYRGKIGGTADLKLNRLTGRAMCAECMAKRRAARKGKYGEPLFET